MGDIPDNEQAWNTLARVNGYKCERCGQHIPFGERQIYFERHLCGYCARLEDKDE